MGNEWLDREMTFEDLELPPELEAACVSELSENDGLPYLEGLDPDAEWIKAVAAGEYRHEMPRREQASNPGKTENITIPALDEKARLAGFADVMGWDRSDFTEAGYLKAVVQNKAGKAAIIKDLTGIKNAEDADGEGGARGQV